MATPNSGSWYSAAQQDTSDVTTNPKETPRSSAWPGVSREDTRPTQQTPLPSITTHISSGGGSQHSLKLSPSTSRTTTPTKTVIAGHQPKQSVGFPQFPASQHATHSESSHRSPGSSYIQSYDVAQGTAYATETGAEADVAAVSSNADECPWPSTSQFQARDFQHPLAGDAEPVSLDHWNAARFISLPARSDLSHDELFDYIGSQFQANDIAMTDEVMEKIEEIIRQISLGE
ncbi:MAG: hypothetical protein M1820_008733 [Bogoriella megaspora]|nr:MAG: hypothetical protein M1820_008733 [Bogoriella megaspora]